MPRILLLGYFGAGNLGDDCLLVDWLSSNAVQLRNGNFIADVVCREQDPVSGFAESAELSDVTGRCVSPREALRLNPLSYSALIAPGGSLLQDATSFNSLLFYLMLIRKFSRARVLLLNQGIGPINGWGGRALTRHYLKRAALLSLRDQASHDWAQLNLGRGMRERILLSADPILAGRLISGAQFAPRGMPPSGLPAGEYFVVIPRATGDLPTRIDPISEPEALARLIRSAAEKLQMRAVLLPFHLERDLEFCEQTLKHTRDAARLYHPQTGSRDYNTLMLSAVSAASFAVSYRLHGLVVAAAHGVPAMGVAYDPKVEAFCDEMELPYCYPATVHESDASAELLRLHSERDRVLRVMQVRKDAMLERLARSEERAHELL